MNLIIDANDHLFLADLTPIPPILPAGLTLRIPVIEQEAIADHLLPPWKRGLA